MVIGDYKRSSFRFKLKSSFKCISTVNIVFNKGKTPFPIPDTNTCYFALQNLDLYPLGQV